MSLERELMQLDLGSVHKSILSILTLEGGSYWLLELPIHFGKLVR